ncbi:MAG TPA: hypothetical protein VFS44_10045 [Gemmatimonadaceae bacterium]|nr:hypothetical protein [Gemmatimonadaceae bacterium]
MDEIINLVSQKVGIPTDKAQLAVTTVLGYLKDRLPSPIASQLDSAVKGGASKGGMAAGLGDVAKDVGGMFGSQKQ